MKLSKIPVSFIILIAFLAAGLTGAFCKPAESESSGRRGKSAKVDIDFTRLSQTMQQTYAYRLGADPAEFANKTLRVSGIFLTRVDEKDGKRYYGCTMGESGCSCCTPGVLEFVPKSSYHWPTNFPPVESTITVTGRVKVYKVTDGKDVYIIPRLDDADISLTLR